MFILSCRQCADEFEAKTARKMYCSQRCRDRGKPSANNGACAVCGGPLQVKGHSSDSPAHVKCRSASIYDESGIAHGQGGYRRGCRCDVCRESKNSAMRRYNAARADREGATPSAAAKRRARGVDPDVSISCFLCTEPLLNVRSSTARYPLHKKCRQTAPEWIRKGRDNPRRAEYQAKIDKAARGTSGGKRVFTCGGCLWCAEYFVGIGKYCSKKCAVSAAYQRRGAGFTFKISKRSRLEIYERDGWICQLCFHPVDPSKGWRTPWSPSLDHIIPQSKMLIPDHSPSNLRLAHMWCNGARGDGSNMTEAQFRKRIIHHFEEAA